MKARGERNRERERERQRQRERERERERVDRVKERKRHWSKLIFRPVANAIINFRP
jgi:hypothetical protein